MHILGIETSCDETSASLIEAEGGKATPVFKVHSCVTHSQIDVHKPYGGVYPTLAKREHERNLPAVIAEALQSMVFKNLDAIAVTVGPGLEPALWTGIGYAQKLATEHALPLIPANHMEGHLVSVLLSSDDKGTNPKKVESPAIGLLVSGGHTELVLVEKWGKYRIIGSTRDDAAGEAFDKVARILELPYPGGPALSQLAQEEPRMLPKNFILPRPMLHSPDYDFSFSGLKTAVLYATREHPELLTDPAQRAGLAAEFEAAAIEVLVSKTARALEEYAARSLIVGGGVIANTSLRQACAALTEHEKVELLLPELRYTGDNAAMIAAAAYLHEPANPATLHAEGSLVLG